LGVKAADGDNESKHSIGTTPLSIPAPDLILSTCAHPSSYLLMIRTCSPVWMESSSGRDGTNVLATTTKVPVDIGAFPAPSEGLPEETMDAWLERGAVRGANCVELTRGGGPPVKDGAEVATGKGPVRL